jgi:Golgi SNAP receptor complex protein 2
MEKLYLETKAILHKINELLAQYEQTVKNDQLENSIKEKINNLNNEINNNLNQLDIYVTKEPAIRKYESKIKVDQIKYDFQHYKAAYNSIQYKK